VLLPAAFGVGEYGGRAQRAFDSACWFRSDALMAVIVFGQEHTLAVVTESVFILVFTLTG
jgi:hypothetical protein